MRGQTCDWTASSPLHPLIGLAPALMLSVERLQPCKDTSNGLCMYLFSLRDSEQTHTSPQLLNECSQFYFLDFPQDTALPLTDDTVLTKTVILPHCHWRLGVHSHLVTVLSVFPVAVSQSAPRDTLLISLSELGLHQLPNSRCCEEPDRSPLYHRLSLIHI